MLVRVTDWPGLGLYPGDPCYAANRDTWVPYWMNVNAETRCLAEKGREPNWFVWPGDTGLVSPPAPAAPQTREQMTSWTPADVAAAAPGQWERWTAEQRATIQTQGGLYSFVNEVLGRPAAEAGWWDRNKWFVLAGGLGVVAVAGLVRR